MRWALLLTAVLALNGCSWAADLVLLNNSGADRLVRMKEESLPWAAGQTLTVRYMGGNDIPRVMRPAPNGEEMSVPALDVVSPDGACARYVLPIVDLPYAYLPTWPNHTDMRLLLDAEARLHLLPKDATYAEGPRDDQPQGYPITAEACDA